MLRKLRTLDDTKDIAEQWQSVYTGIAIISNRLTRLHRDRKGRPEWFDTLLSFSEIGTSPRFIVEDIGLDLDYSSGALVGFCGSIFRHGVDSWGTGNRICYAHFMRESVRERLNVDAAGFVDRKKYLTGAAGQELISISDDMDYEDVDDMDVN
jgi:hypothetical protein